MNGQGSFTFKRNPPLLKLPGKCFLVDRLQKTMAKFTMNSHGCTNNGKGLLITIVFICVHLRHLRINILHAGNPTFVAAPKICSNCACQGPSASTAVCTSTVCVTRSTSTRWPWWPFIIIQLPSGLGCQKKFL
ncbi:hypothetical protein PMI15_04089 [Polaromonas sp. CF318]|nr:hypothetical protein PMI15_04089 [Polaromonas sp. CF318]